MIESDEEEWSEVFELNSKRKWNVCWWACWAWQRPFVQPLRIPVKIMANVLNLASNHTSASESPQLVVTYWSDRDESPSEVFMILELNYPLVVKSPSYFSFSLPFLGERKKTRKYLVRYQFDEIWLRLIILAPFFDPAIEQRHAHIYW